VLNIAALQTGWPYLAALACGMLVTFIQFVSLVRSLWESVDGRPG
jgi:TRAP-type C4-dicarboxylate transport system permease small subunit